MSENQNTEFDRAISDCEIRAESLINDSIPIGNFAVGYVNELITAAKRLQELERENSELRESLLNLADSPAGQLFTERQKLDGCERQCAMQEKEIQDLQSKLARAKALIESTIDNEFVSTGENAQILADTKKMVEALAWVDDFLDKLFTIHDKGGAFIGGREYAGVEKRLDQISEALSTPTAQQILNGGKS